jgi:DNA-binding CsgD family transcriptional regulator
MLTSSQQQELLCCVQKIDNTATFRQTCEKLASALGADYYLFCLFKPTGVIQSRVFLDSNFPSEWLARYLKDDLNLIDPIVEHCKYHYTPIDWSSLDEVVDKKSRQVLEDAVRVGLVDGISVPIHGRSGRFGVLSLASREQMTAEQRLDIITQAPLFTPYLHEVASSFSFDEEPSYQLTSRELECLAWACEGKTTWEISQILSISESTVNFHLNNTIKKTRAVNRQQAIAKALLSGTLLHGQLTFD